MGDGTAAAGHRKAGLELALGRGGAPSLPAPRDDA
jgi:hypothetical protein